MCIPVYNRRTLVKRAIKSALTQSLRRLEVVVVDNCSTDGTWEVMRGLSDKRLRVVRNETNLGMFGNFNRCLEAATGDYVRFLCSDDELTNETLAAEVRLLRDRPEVALLSTRCLYVDESGAHSRLAARLAPAGAYCGQDAVRMAAWALGAFGGNVFNFPSGVLLRTDAARLAGSFDAGLHGLADVDFWLRVLEHGDAYFADHAGCLVGEHDGRASHRLFWDGLYMRGHFEVVRRRANVLGADVVAATFRRMSGRCLGYALRAALSGRWESALTHLRLLRRYQASAPKAGVELARELLRRRRWRREGQHAARTEDMLAELGLSAPTDARSLTLSPAA